jgi:transcriptional regulator with XRE-family HTH domain
MTVLNIDSARSEPPQAEQEFRRLFAERFGAALDQHPNIPNGHGRGQAVAGLFGISRATAGKWLNGEGLPDLWRLPHLAQLLNVDVNELVGGTTSPMTIDDRYVSINMHNQDHPDEIAPLFLQPSSLQSTGLASGCMLMQVSTNDMLGYVSVGDMVIYNPGLKWISTGTDVYIFRVHGSYVLRRAVRTLRGETILSSEAGNAQESFRGEDFTSEAKGASNLIYVVGRVVARVLLREATARG